MTDGTSININHADGIIQTRNDKVLTLMNKGAIKIGDGTYLDELGDKQDYDINKDMVGALRYNAERKCLQVCDGRVWNDVNGKYKQKSNIIWSLMF